LIKDERALPMTLITLSKKLQRKRKLSEYIIVYKDTEGSWDGYDLKKGFLVTNADNWQDSVKRILDYYLS